MTRRILATARSMVCHSRRLNSSLKAIAVVVYTEREEDLIRIIGARLATRSEQERYHAYKEQQR